MENKLYKTQESITGKDLASMPVDVAKKVVALKKIAQDISHATPQISGLKQVRDALCLHHSIVLSGEEVSEKSDAEFYNALATLDGIIAGQDTPLASSSDHYHLLVPDGYKLVPIDPTDLPCGLTMPLPDGRIIGENQRIESIVSIEDAYKCAEILHKAMLSAAPTPDIPENVDVEKLKLDIRQKINEHLMVEDSGLVAVCVRMSIDHIAAAGYLREPLEHIDGLYDAISAYDLPCPSTDEECENIEKRYKDHRDIYGCDVSETLSEAARAYLKLQGAKDTQKRKRPLYSGR